MKRMMTRITALSCSFALAGFIGLAGAAAAQGQGQGADQQLEQEASPGSGTQLTISPATVRQVQQALNERGYDTGNVDGSWGPGTQRAVLNFQQAQGLEPTGQLNRKTLAALGVGQGQQDQGQPGQQGQGMQP